MVFRCSWFLWVCVPLAGLAEQASGPRFVHVFVNPIMALSADGHPETVIVQESSDAAPAMMDLRPLLPALLAEREPGQPIFLLQTVNLFSLPHQFRERADAAGWLGIGLLTAGQLCPECFAHGWRGMKNSLLDFRHPLPLAPGSV
jgi:hypothetical protein